MVTVDASGRSLNRHLRLQVTAHVVGFRKDEDWASPNSSQPAASHIVMASRFGDVEIARMEYEQ